MESVLFILFLLAIPILGIAGFVIALGLRRRVAALEQSLGEALRALELLARQSAGRQTSPEQAPPELEPDTAPASAILAPPVEPPAIPLGPAVPPLAIPAPPTAVPPIRPAPAAAPAGAAASAQGFEERLGTRWAVWVGGVALALGGIFLVRYSIEQGLLGPGARLTFGALFAAALLGAGEWMRRRERALDIPGIPSAHVPSVLTAAGTLTAFGTVYAAYALYGFLTPALAFVLLGAVALLTLAAAALHGPALAAIGLAASLGTPLLIDSGTPQVWPVALYLAVVVAAAYGLARLRDWELLAMAAAAGAVFWTAPFILIEKGSLPVMAHVLAQAALAGLFLVADPYRRTGDADAHPDWLASFVLAALAVLGIFVATLATVEATRPLFLGLLAAGLVVLAVRFAPAAAAAASAALLLVGALLLWPLAREVGAEPLLVLPRLGGPATTPTSIVNYLVLATLAATGLAGAGIWRLGTGRDLRPVLAAFYAGGATVGPLLILVVAYLQVTGFKADIPFALAAGLLGALFAAATRWLRGRETNRMDAVRFGTGAAASAAVAALALGLTFALDEGMLTVAFALAALGTAWVSVKLEIFPLRYAVGAIGVIVLARLGLNPRIVDGHPGSLLLFNWILWGYGVPAVAFFLASRLLAGARRDRVVDLLEGLALAFSAFLVFFEIRHALNGGNIVASRTDHLEVGLMATASLVFSIVLVKVKGALGETVGTPASLLFKAVSFGAVILGLFVAENPLFVREPVLGGPLFNSLLPAYLLPAALAALLAYTEIGRRPAEQVRASAALALALQLAYVVLEIRRLFQGPIITTQLATSQPEQWTYSLALLAMGIGLLAIGFLRRSRFLRLGSAAYIILAVAKVFLVDLSNLEGVMRALSFIGLGLALVGIGLAYQKLLRRSPPAASDAV